MKLCHEKNSPNNHRGIITEIAIEYVICDKPFLTSKRLGMPQ